MTKKINFNYVLPVLMSFFVMSFCDLVGISLDRAKEDMNLTNTLAGLIPMAVFVWFFVFSVSVGTLQDRFGKRVILNAGMVVTALGLLLPYFFYSFVTLLTGFAFLGIGNTIVQVSANPLLVDVVPREKTSSFLSFSQFIKSIGSMAAPFLAGWLAIQFGDWKLLFLVFGIVSILAVLWLSAVKIEESKNTEARATMASSFRLLGNGYITMMVIGIFLVVGIDVGVNAVSGQFIMSKFGAAQEFAEKGRSIYFFGKMLGTFLGALMLARLSSRRFFIRSSVLGLIAAIALILAPNQMIAMVIIFIVGLGFANIFPLIFSLTVEKFPNRSNEISGLMMMAISGGAVIPFVITKVIDSISLSAGMFVLILCAVYLLFLAIINKNKN
jgi:fucose permease